MNKYFRLMRFDKPIGIYLLLYPTLWALLLSKTIDLKIWLIFIIGVIIMRSCGCIINDFADRKIDKLVARTKNRPITNGEISVKLALILFAFLMILAFVLVLFTNQLTFLLSLFAAFMAILYPFSKRFFVMPQIFLGIAYAMSVPMVFSANLNFVPNNSWLIFLATIIWTIIYDSAYAMSDREEDSKIGIHSSAIFFGKFDKLIIAILQVILLILFILIGIAFALNYYYYYSLIIVLFLMLHHQFLIKDRDKEHCFRVFLYNQYIGLVVFFGIVFSV